jgi:hypothetical protein
MEAMNNADELAVGSRSLTGTSGPAPVCGCLHTCRASAGGCAALSRQTWALALLLCLRKLGQQRPLYLTLSISLSPSLPRVGGSPVRRPQLSSSPLLSSPLLTSPLLSSPQSTQCPVRQHRAPSTPEYPVPQCPPVPSTQCPDGCVPGREPLSLSQALTPPSSLLLKPARLSAHHVLAQVPWPAPGSTTAPRKRSRNHRRRLASCDGRKALSPEGFLMSSPASRTVACRLNGARP